LVLVPRNRGLIGGSRPFEDWVTAERVGGG